MIPELSRKVSLVEVERRPRTVEVVASPVEREQLARRFGILGIEELTGELTVRTEASGWYVVTGPLRARVVQECVRSLQPLSRVVEVDVEVRLTTDSSLAPDDGLEVEISSGDEIEFVAGEEVDVGELATQQLSMALDPYPRSEDPAAPAVDGVTVVWGSEARETAAQTPEPVRNRPFANLRDLLAKD